MARPMTIGQLAEAAGVSTGTVRYYEQIGVLQRPPRSAAGYRQYQPDAVRRLTLIRHAQAFGFSLREIVSFLNVRDRGGAPCRTVRAAAQQMLDAIDAQIEALVARRRAMRRTLERWDERLAKTPNDTRAHLLETLRN